MATQATAETITLRLEQQIDRSADAALGALSRLERQIQREENALGRLERSLVDARAKLDVMGSGAPSEKAVAAFEKQRAAVDALQAKLQTANASLAKMQDAGSPKAIAAAQKSVDALQAKLAEAKTKLDALAGPAKGGVVDIAAYKRQRDAVAALVDRIEAQRDKIEGLRAQQSGAAGASRQLSSAVELLIQKSGAADSQMVALGKSLIALGPYGMVAAAAVLAVSGAIAVMVSAIVKGITSAGQMRSELLQLQASSVATAGGMHWLFNATRESWVQADKLQQMINRVNATSSLGREKIAGYAAQINAARFRGEQAEKVLKAMSVAGSAGSEAMAGDVLNWAKAMRFAGGSVDNLAARVEQKLGKTAMAKAIALDVQMRRLGENITWIFGGADIDPFLRALNSVLSLFNAGTGSAQSMRDMVTRLAEMAIGGMLRLGIAVLSAYISLRKNEAAWTAVTWAAKGVLVLFGVVTAAVGLLMATIVATNAAVMALAATIGVGLFNAMAWVWDKAVEIIAQTIAIGVAIVDGIVNGITTAGPRVWQALKLAVGGAVDKVKNLLGIASPSKIGVGIGHNFTSSIGLGESKGEAAVVAGARHAGATMVDEMSSVADNDVRAPTASPRQPTQAQVTTQGGKSVTFTGCTFGQVTEGQIRQWVLAALEGDAIAAGAAA